MAEDQTPQYVLGIDLGTNSVGWAIIRLIDGEPAGLIRAGVRIFDAGMDDRGGPGREESRNKARRDARLQRRQTWRRARRLRKIFNTLQSIGLLPAGSSHTPEARQDLLNELDRRILASPWFAGKRASGRFPEPDQTMPYILRAAALDEALEPHFLGRALYHLAQRRGFLSNRKATAKEKEDDEGAVKEGIAELRKAMADTESDTLGQYFSRIAPSAERIRRRWTARDMYTSEFEAIWNSQAPHHPLVLTGTRKKELHDAFFFQRPLWFDPDAIGRCELEPRRRRAPAYLLASQRFRVLQTVNNLRVLPPGEPDMPLTPADRRKLTDVLEMKREMTFSQVRKLLGLTKDYAFNLEQGGEKRIKGNRTSADLHAALGKRWIAMSPPERDRLVDYVHGFQDAGKLAESAARKWDLDEETARKLSVVTFEPEYLSLSRQAIEKLLPLLEQGLTFAEARKEAYPKTFEPGDPKPLLEPVSEALTAIRNPAVTRSLTELRKVVNAVIRQHGKPTHIRVELARDLRKSKRQRKAIADSYRRNQAAREKARAEIISKANIGEPSRDDIRKLQLWEECGGVCPYTGRSISVDALFESQFEIEHIIPFSVSMDNSFQNLTLCHAAENRDKHNHTPHQAYSGHPDRYEAILERVRHFNGDPGTRSAKLRRFSMDDEQLQAFLEDFRNRQLNDTSYASRLAAGYLGTLYGGSADAEGNRRVHATSGQATSDFRALWQLNSILNDGPTTSGGYVPKSRDDHRHHAVDAVVIALTDDAMIKRLADAARRAPAERRRKFGVLQAPWPDFTDSIRREVDRIVVSHRVAKKVGRAGSAPKIRGALHEDTIYSAPDASGLCRVRKPLRSITKNEVASIADPRIRELVRAKLAELGGDPKKFGDEANLPSIPTKSGHAVPIRRVRVRKARPTFALRAGRTVRHVASESNHHVEIFARLDARGDETAWTGRVVSLAEAAQRLKSRQPLVNRDNGPGTRFKFSLAPGEVIQCDNGPGAHKLWAVRGATSENGAPRLFLTPGSDARKKPEIVAARLYWRPFLGTLRKAHARKVAISPLGEVTEAHD